MGDLILVVDVGGGTTDFTLIAVTESDGELQLERLAVGEHILLGGDNIDLALARHLEQQLAAKGTKLDALQLHALWQQCRVAKEKLLSEETKKGEFPVTILGKGTGLVGGTIKAKLLKDDIDRILLEGFFPVVSSNEMPQRRRMGLAELGLPYAADAAITRHLARFLRQQVANAEHGSVRRSASGLACPTHVLFNGGVLRADIVRKRIIEVLNNWLKQESMERGEGAAWRGSDARRSAGRGLLWNGAGRARSPHPWRNPPHVLCRHRKLDARGARNAGPAQSSHCRAVRHGGRNGSSTWTAVSSDSLWESLPSSDSSIRL